MDPQELIASLIRAAMKGMKNLQDDSFTPSQDIFSDGVWRDFHALYPIATAKELDAPPFERANLGRWTKEDQAPRAYLKHNQANSDLFRNFLQATRMVDSLLPEGQGVIQSQVVPYLRQYRREYAPWNPGMDTPPPPLLEFGHDERPRIDTRGDSFR